MEIYETYEEYIEDIIENCFIFNDFDLIIENLGIEELEYIFENCII